MFKAKKAKNFQKKEVEGNSKIDKEA